MNSRNPNKWKIKEHTMKISKRLIVIIITIGISQTSYSQVDSVGKISESERQLVLDYLTDSKDSLLVMLKDLNNEQWTFKPSPDAWSIANVCEHLVLVEQILFTQITKEISTNNRQVNGKSLFKDEEIMPIMTNREKKSKSRTEFLPNKIVISLGKAKNNYKSERKKSLKFLKKTDKSLRYFFGKLTPETDAIDAYQFFIFIAGHNLRHNAQIKEIMNNKDFPN